MNTPYINNSDDNNLFKKCVIKKLLNPNPLFIKRNHNGYIKCQFVSFI